MTEQDINESTSIKPNKGVQYIQKRINSLHDIDAKALSFIDNLSTTLNILKDGKQHPENKKNAQIQFNESINKVYSDLSFVATHLRKEIKIWDTKVHSNSNTQGDLHNLNILPIQLNKKATWVNKAKFNEELSELDSILGKDFQSQIDKKYLEQKLQVQQTKQDIISTTQPIESSPNLSRNSPSDTKTENGNNIEVIDLDDDVFDNGKVLSKSSTEKDSLEIDDSDVDALFENDGEIKSEDSDIKMEL